MNKLPTRLNPFFIRSQGRTEATVMAVASILS